jgi:hypothetical protein
VRTKCPIRNAANPELLVANKEELARRSWSCGSARRNWTYCRIPFLGRRRRRRLSFRLAQKRTPAMRCRRADDTRVADLLGALFTEHDACASRMPTSRRARNINQCDDVDPSCSHHGAARWSSTEKTIHSRALLRLASLTRITFDTCIAGPPNRPVPTVVFSPGGFMRPGEYKVLLESAAAVRALRAQPPFRPQAA